MEEEGYESLTKREREVLQLLLHGNTNKEIGRILHISNRTVEVHRLHAMDKLGSKNIYQLAYRVACQNFAVSELPKAYGFESLAQADQTLLRRIDALVGLSQREGFVNAAIEKALAQFELTKIVIESNRQPPERQP